VVITEQSHCHLQYIILANILYVKLIPYAEAITITKEGRSTVDQIFIMRQIFEICWKQNVDFQPQILHSMQTEEHNNGQRAPTKVPKT